jgi:hypothetical protein
MVSEDSRHEQSHFFLELRTCQEINYILSHVLYTFLTSQTPKTEGCDFRSVIGWLCRVFFSWNLHGYNNDPSTPSMYVCIRLALHARTMVSCTRWVVVARQPSSEETGSPIFGSGWLGTGPAYLESMSHVANHTVRVVLT